MTKVPNSRTKRNNGGKLQVEGDARAKNTTRRLNDGGRKNRNMAADARGRQGGGGFPKGQVK
jgi:hypothetical protein